MTTIAPPWGFRVLGALLAAGTVSGACKRPAPLTVPASDVSTSTSGTAAPTTGGPPTGAPPAGKPPTGEPLRPAPTGGRAEAAVPDFANRVWKVAKGSAGDPGTFYVFLADGSMLITSPHGKPSLGTWHYSGDVLTLVEEGLPHQATILHATLDTFAISGTGSGEPVVLTFVPGAAK